MDQGIREVVLEHELATLGPRLSGADDPFAVLKPNLDGWLTGVTHTASP
jgi:hypothetical protein